ncbi:MAG: hypothetical protein E7160_05150 [Firmicutes bacterium]|nr:hypothetical protein [Bacillota bacterium]
MSKSVKMLIILLFTYLTLLLFSIDTALFECMDTSNGLYNRLSIVLNDFNLIDFFIFPMIYFFYYSVYFNGEKYAKKNFLFSFISIVFAFITLFSRFLQHTSTFPNLLDVVQLVETLIILSGSYILFYALLKKVTSIDIFSEIEYLSNKIKIKKEFKLFRKGSLFVKKHPFFSIFILIMVCRLPYVIVYYPGVVNGDTFDQLCQFFFRDSSWSVKMVNLVNENVYLNGHHPVFSTLYMGVFVKIGELVTGNKGIGLFFYTFTQCVLSSVIFAYMLYYMKKIKVPSLIWIISLIMVCLLPFYASYSIAAIKDTPESLFTLLYVMFLLQIVRDYKSIYENKSMIISFIVVMMLVLLFRNNGLITILFSYPLLVFVYRKNIGKVLLVLFIPLVIFFSFNQVMYRCFDVSKGSKKEMLSVPFQQVARLFNKKGYDAMSKSDKEKLDKFVEYKKMAKFYNPEISDPVKDLYRMDSTDEDFKEFFKVWYKYFKKYPTIYMASFINGTYQYFYPYETYENIYLIYDYVVTEEFSDIHPVYEFDGYKARFDNLFIILNKIPIFGLLFKVAFYDFILLMSVIYVIYKKKYKYLIPLMALLSVLLVCLASPLNGAMRYILPIFFSAPIILSIDYLVYKEGK